MDPKNKAKKASMILDVVMLCAGIICLVSAASMKDSYRYYFDSDLRNNVSLMQVMGYVCMLWGGISLAIGAMRQNSVEQSDLSSNLFTCPDCQNTISVNANSCPHCGWENPVRKERHEAELNADSAGIQKEKIPAWMQVEMEKENKE